MLAGKFLCRRFVGVEIYDANRAFAGDVADRIDAHASASPCRAGEVVFAWSPAAPVAYICHVAHKDEIVRSDADIEPPQRPAARGLDIQQAIR